MPGPQPASQQGFVEVVPEFAAALAGAGLDSLWALSDRRLGEPVATSRSSWVRRVEVGEFSCYVKTYDYPGWRDRLRGALRTTWLAASRARREWSALCWLRHQGFAGPRPLAVLEERRLGALRRAALISEAYPGDPLHTLLPSLPAAERDRALEAVVRLVEALHEAGFRDGNLDLRNLLGRRREDGRWEIAKIDSPRHRLVQPGRATDAAAAADWQRLARSLKAAGL